VRGLARRWLFTESNGGDGTTAADRPRDSSLIDRILLARGVASQTAIESFLDPRLSSLHDPALLGGCSAAAEAIAETVKARRRIVIYGDYDVDGITATSILYHIIRAADPAADVRTYVPHRLDEGYGLNADALRQLHADGAQLVISVDCGISAIEPARVARSIGLPLIITDHHTLPADNAPLPEALAIVHPRLPGGGYSFGELCGAGVAFKVAWRFASVWCGSSRVSQQFQQVLLDMLPLVALGTIADVVPLVGENRVLVSYGLRLIRRTPLAGLAALIEASELMDQKIDSEKVGFVLAPRLNACGRMGHAAEAIEMLTIASAESARAIAANLCRQNRDRQRSEREIFQQAAQLAEDRGMTRDDCRAIVLDHPSWHPGVVGIVCSRLVDRFCRPAILMQNQGEICKGSARSIEGYSIHEALCSASAHLQTWGGHDMAAGLSLRSAHLEAFIEKLLEHANSRIALDQLMPTIRVDCDAGLGELDPLTVRKIAMLSPFGRGNPQPVLRLRCVTVAEAPRQMGRNGRHLSMLLRSDVTNGSGLNGSPRSGGDSKSFIRAVWWNGGQHASSLGGGMRLDAVIEPKLNTWNGSSRVEAHIEDVRVLEAAPACA
jgi:single-stranded-DNA-specific exonuclease